ncbi:MAG: hypothetical protein EBZ36_18960, partial [Acidobacteria bacterium]|nr:hypothetical protein [Acidobacteriota bacterium]
MDRKDHKITVYGGASERVECDYGEPFPALPSSFCLISPTSGGKTVTLTNIFCKFYKDKFERIFLFSPTVRLDEQYKPLIKMIEKSCDQEREPLIFEDFSMAKLGQIIADQRKIVEECRKRKLKPPQIAIILDDLAERADILQTRKGGAAVSGRHSQITWCICAQKMSMISRGIMAQVRCLIVGRLRSKHEIDVLAEELSGLAGSKDAALALIDHATRDPFSFLFVRLDAKTRADTFWLRFERRLTVKDSASKERDSDGDDGESVGDRSGDLQPLRKDGPTTRKA